MGQVCVTKGEFEQTSQTKGRMSTTALGHSLPCYKIVCVCACLNVVGYKPSTLNPLESVLHSGVAGVFLRWATSRQVLNDGGDAERREWVGAPRLSVVCIRILGAQAPETPFGGFRV